MKKISRLLMLIALLVNQFGWPMLAWAQEATLTETPTPTETPVVTETPVPTPEPTITETPIPTETPIITETPTPTETPIPTDTETPNPIETSTITPEPVNTEIPIPTETETPVPTETPLPGQTTSTETSTVSLPDKPTETPPPSLSETELLLAAANQNKSTTPTPEPVAKLLVEVSDNESGINNSAQICQDNQATADSGNNQISDNSHLGSSTIVSGEALALANIINVVNTNSVGSTIKLYLLDNVTGQVGEIDLNTAWNLLVSNGYNIEVAAVDAAKQDNEYSINNLGVIDNKLQVTANSGSNQIMADNNAGIYTGDAYALANIFNLLNINLQNSTLLVGIINVDGSSLENIILPNPESFSLAGERIETLSGEINNTAVIDSQVTNTANSGNNQINNNGDSSIQTGAALATTNVLTSANLNLSSTNQLMVALNILGEWTGQIYNFYGLGTAVNGGLNNLFLIGQQAKEEAQTDRLADINNTAMITNSVTVEATSGNNKITADGEATIKTGNAWSMANIFNMANLNLFNSNGFYMMINVLGNWKGNVIFAYPDLALSLGLSNDQLKIGEETNIKVNYANVGDDNTNSNNKIEIDLPENLEYVSDNSGLPLKRNNHKLMWQVDNMPAKAARNFIVRAKLISDNQTGWFLVQPAIAAEATAKSEVIINGQISTSRTETTTDNNNAQAVVYVNINGTETITNSGEETTLWPKLVITEKNNVNNWVYKNDTVTFEINGKNEGEATAYNSYLLQSISDSKGNLLAKNRINIGDIVVGRPGKIVFGLPIKFNFYNDEKLTTKTELVGYTQKGEEVRSNVTQTSFILKSRMIKEVQAIDNNKIQTENAGQVLGTTNSETQTNKNLWVYLLLFSTSSVWMIRQTRKWLVKN